MSERNFRLMLELLWDENKFVCVGLDPDYEKLPPHLKSGLEHRDVFEFNMAIATATADLALAFKLNAAFYEDIGPGGFSALLNTVECVHILAPKVPVILDFKRGDVIRTNPGYVRSAFEHCQSDAVTVNPYLGGEPLEPFLKKKEKGIIVLCRTSNPGAAEFQDRLIAVSEEEFPLNDPPRIFIGDNAGPRKYLVPLYQFVAQRVGTEWNRNGNCMLVVGATAPEQLAAVRKIVHDMPILIPGIGTQGGDLEKTIAAGKDSRGKGMIINASSSIIFASSGEDFAEAARRETLKLHNAINRCLGNGALPPGVTEELLMTGQAFTKAGG